MVSRTSDRTAASVAYSVAALGCRVSVFSQQKDKPMLYLPALPGLMKHK